MSKDANIAAQESLAENVKQIGRFESGQIIERWGSSDELGIMQQLGADVSPKSGLAKLADELGS